MTDAEAETPAFWSPDANSQLTGKVQFWKRFKAEGEEDVRIGWLDDITKIIDMSLGKLQEMVRDREAQCAAAYGVAKSQTRMGDWTTNTELINLLSFPESQVP